MADVGIRITGKDDTGSAFSDVSRKMGGLKKDTELVGETVGAMVEKFKAMGIALAGAFTIGKLYEYAKETALLAARYETLGVSMKVVGEHAGYTGAQMDAAALGMQQMGISMVEARQQAMRLVQAHIDLADAQKLARIAQDAAVIGNINSTEAFAAMIHGISTGQPEVLRTIGLNVSMENSYKAMAVTLGKHVDQLTQNEKTQGILNAVMLAGADIAGTYEAAMDTAGKQINSMKRYTEDLKTVNGEVFNEALTTGVMAFTAHLKGANEEAKALAANNELKSWGEGVTDVLASLADTANDAYQILNLVGKTAAMLAAAGNTTAREKGKRSAIWEAYKSDVADAFATEQRFSKALADRRAAVSDKATKAQAETLAKDATYTTAMNAYAQQRQAGLMTEAQYAKTVQTVYQAMYGDNHKYRDAPAMAAPAKAITEATKGLQLYNDLMDQSAGFEKTWAEDSNKLRAALDGKKISQTQFNDSVNVLLAKQPLMLAAAKAEEQWQTEVVKANEAVAKAREDSLKSIQGELEKQNEQNAAIGLNVVALAELEAAKLTDLAIDKDRLAAMADNIDFSGQLGQSYRDEAQALRDLASAKVSGAVKKTNYDAAQDMQKEQKKAAEESAKYWEDALMRAFESGKGFFQGLWDTIKNTLKTQVLKVTVQGVMGTLGIGSAGSAMAGQSSGNLLGTAGTLKSMYDTISGGFTQIGSTISSGFNTLATSDFGASIGMSTNVGGGVGNAMTPGMAQFGQGFGTVAGAAAGAVAGLAIGKAISGEFGSSVTVAVGTAIGSIWGPIGGAIGGAIGGLVNRAFGMGNTELTSSGTRGTFAGSNFSGSNYANYKKEGGWFRSNQNWTDTSAIDPKTVDSWQTAFVGVKSSMAGMTTSLGLATDKISSYTRYIDVAAGTTAEQITALFTTMADEMAVAVAPGIAALAKTGETASTTLSRLSASITTANSWLGMLRNRLFDISLAGADAASKLVDAFGSLDNLAASSKAYYEAFYSEAERTATSADNLAKAMALIGVAMPDTKAAFRDVVASLDLTTDSGRKAYAVMLALAPEYAAAADAADKAAQATAKSLLDAFTGNGLIVPALKSSTLAIGDVATGAGSMTTALTYINKIMGDASSGAIALGGNVATLGTGLTESQVSAGLLADQIVALRAISDSATINFAGLSAALLGVNSAGAVKALNDIGVAATGISTDPVTGSITAINTALGSIKIDPVTGAMTGVNKALGGVSDADVVAAVSNINTALKGVDTATFVATLTAVFENLALRIKSVISSISAERVAVREAALQIINPTAMSKAEILRGIGGINTTLPGNSNAVAANALLAAADATLAQKQAALDVAKASVDAVPKAQAAATALSTYYQGAASDFMAMQAKYGVYANATAGGYNTARDAYSFNATTNRVTDYGQISYGSGADVAGFKAAQGSLVSALSGANSALAASEKALADARAGAVADLKPYTDAVAVANTSQIVAQLAAKKAALDYASALQTFTIDAGKSVTKLTNLREQTVKYYEAQKALADLMMTSAAGLRKTIADYQYSTLTPEQQLASLQGQFSNAYSLALASQGDGATLASYGDKVNSLLNPLISKLQEVGQGGLVTNYLSQAEAVAALIDKVIPVNYQQDSLDMLGSIDTTLAALDTATRSAEQVIADAVTAGANRTAEGLKAVGEAISGKTLPAFAKGGAYGGGLALVGEQGPELINFNQGGQVYNAQQTSGMFGNNEAIISELQALRSELRDLRAEARAGAIAANKTAKILERVTPDGASLQTVSA